MSNKTGGAVARRNPAFEAKRAEVFSRLTPATQKLVRETFDKHIVKNQLSTTEHAHATGKALLKIRDGNVETYGGAGAITDVAEYFGMEEGRNRLFQFMKLAEVFTIEDLRGHISEAASIGFTKLKLEHFIRLSEVDSEPKRQKFLDKAFKNQLSGRELDLEIKGGRVAASGSGGRGRKIAKPKSLQGALIKGSRLYQHALNYSTTIVEMISLDDVKKMDSVEEMETIRQRSLENEEAATGLTAELTNLIKTQTELRKALEERRDEILAANTQEVPEQAPADAIGRETEFSDEEFTSSPPSAPAKKATKKVMKKVKKVKKAPAAPVS